MTLKQISQSGGMRSRCHCVSFNSLPKIEAGLGISLDFFHFCIIGFRSRLSSNTVAHCERQLVRSIPENGQSNWNDAFKRRMFVWVLNTKTSSGCGHPNQCRWWTVVAKAAPKLLRWRRRICTAASWSPVANSLSIAVYFNFRLFFIVCSRKRRCASCTCYWWVECEIEFNLANGFGSSLLDCFCFSCHSCWSRPKWTTKMRSLTISSMWKKWKSCCERRTTFWFCLRRMWRRHRRSSKVSAKRHNKWKAKQQLF